MYEKYRIMPNESIDDIAIKFYTSPDTIMDINNVMFKDTFRAGMDIIVPNNSKKYFDEYTINKGDTLFAIGKKYNINPELLAVINGLNMDDYIYPNQKLYLPLSEYSYYITDEGDSLLTLEDKFKVSKDDIIKNNKDLYLLPSQVIVIKKH